MDATLKKIGLAYSATMTDALNADNFDAFVSALNTIVTAVGQSANVARLTSATSQYAAISASADTIVATKGISVK